MSHRSVLVLLVYTHTATYIDIVELYMGVYIDRLIDCCWYTGCPAAGAGVGREHSGRPAGGRASSYACNSILIFI